MSGFFLSMCCLCSGGPHMLRRYDSLGTSTISLRAFAPVSTVSAEELTSVAPLPGPNAGAIVKGLWANNPGDPSQYRIARVDDAGNKVWDIVLPVARISHEVIRASATEFVMGRARTYTTVGTRNEYIEWRDVADGALLRDAAIDMSLTGSPSWTRNKLTDITANANLDVAFCFAGFPTISGKTHATAAGFLADGSALGVGFSTSDFPADPSDINKSMADVSSWPHQQLSACILDDQSLAISAALPRPSTGINPSFTTAGRTDVPIYSASVLLEGTNWEDVAGWGSGWGGKILSGDGTRDTLAIKRKGYGDPIGPDYTWGTLTGSYSPVSEPTDSLQLDFCNDRNGGACFGGVNVYRQGPLGLAWSSPWYAPAYPLAACRAVNVDDDNRLWAVGGPTE